MFNDLSSPRAFLATRRSGRPRDMVAPGPDAATLDAILDIAIRTPDHGKLAPWRFVKVEKEQREAFAALLKRAYLAGRPEAGRIELDAVESFARQAPSLVVVLFSPKESSKIPLWEQQLSCGAACMNLLAAVHAHGFVGGWVTGWASYDETVRDAFGSSPEQIAGFVFIGSPGAALEERPRPVREAVISRWEPPVV